ncbi:MAG: LysR family transcriptional regulator [Marinibacterium sp.]|nr:LysR family transcriptional regulator [Marinibacterium sp.]
MRDWDSLRYVLAIARGGGLNPAARDLGVTHATVSRQLARAEAQAGTSLFTRGANGMTPTEAGHEAARRAAAIEAEVLALDLAMAARDDGATGALHVTAPPLMMRSGVAEDLARYRALFPRVALTVTGDNSVLNLHRREADVAIRVARAPGDSLWGRVVARQQAGWFGRSDLVARHAAGAGPVPVLSFTHWARPLPDEIAQLPGGAEIAAVTDDMDSALALVRAGVALARMPCFLGQADGLVRFPGLPLIDYAPIWVLTHPDLRQVPRIRRFLSLVADGFSQRRAIYLGDTAPETWAKG